MDMASLVVRIQRTPRCRVYPPDGLPTIKSEHVLPDDLISFYKLCGGADLFEPERNTYGILIVPPRKLVLANPVIMEGLSEEELATTSDDVSWSWYIIGEAANSQYITIDLSRERLGRCYDSFWEVHPGNSPIIASTFTDLLVHLLENRGEHFYWLRQDFNPLGDAHH